MLVEGNSDGIVYKSDSVATTPVWLGEDTLYNSVNWNISFIKEGTYRLCAEYLTDRNPRLLVDSNGDKDAYMSITIGRDSKDRLVIENMEGWDSKAIDRWGIYAIDV